MSHWPGSPGALTRRLFEAGGGFWTPSDVGGCSDCKSCSQAAPISEAYSAVSSCSVSWALSGLPSLRVLNQGFSSHRCEYLACLAIVIYFTGILLQNFPKYSAAWFIARPVIFSATVLNHLDNGNNLWHWPHFLLRELCCGIFNWYSHFKALLDDIKISTDWPRQHQQALGGWEVSAAGRRCYSIWCQLSSQASEAAYPIISCARISFSLAFALVLKKDTILLTLLWIFVNPWRSSTAFLTMRLRV